MPIVAPTPIDELPIPPSTTDIESFDSRGDAFNLALQESFQPQANALAENVFGNAQSAHADAEAASISAGEADSSKNAAAASAQTALNAPGTSGTSTTSLTIGAGAKSFTTQSGKAWVVGQPAIIARTSAPSTTRMSGTITAYNAGTGAMTVAVDATTGTGTFTDWTISLGTARAPDSLPIQVITANTVGVTGFHYVLAAAGITLTLPALPAKDLCIAFSNASGASTCAVNFGSTALRGRAPGVMYLDILDARCMLQSTGNATYGWV